MKTNCIIFLCALLVAFACGCETDQQSRRTQTSRPTPSPNAFVGSCMRGDLRAVRSALEAGVDPDVRYSDGSTTCMIQAAAGGNAEIVRALLDADANPNEQRQTDGYTALMNAALRGHGRTVDILLSNGADPAVKNDHGQNAAAVARLRGHSSLASQIESAEVANE